MSFPVKDDGVKYANGPVDSEMSAPAYYEQDVIVALEHGLHLVPCSKIAELAKRYQCNCIIIKDGRSVDAKTIFDLMTLGAVKGTRLTLHCQGEKADELIEKLVALFEADFQS